MSYQPIGPDTDGQLFEATLAEIEARGLGRSAPRAGTRGA